MVKVMNFYKNKCFIDGTVNNIRLCPMLKFGLFEALIARQEKNSNKSGVVVDYKRLTKLNGIVTKFMREQDDNEDEELQQPVVYDDGEEDHFAGVNSPAAAAVVANPPASARKDWSQ